MPILTFFLMKRKFFLTVTSIEDLKANRNKGKRKILPYKVH